MPKSLFKLSTPIPWDKTDCVEGFLFENAPSNWALEVNHITGDGLLNGFFTSEKDMLRQRSIISNEIGYFVELNFSVDLINDEDWKESYKVHFTPWCYRNFNLIPLWLKNTFRGSGDEISLFLDPGMAFGTGNHESTRMCLEFLIEKNRSQKKSDSILDLGCGSGILSLAAKLIGYKEVLGIDNDHEAVRISKENALLNDLEGKISFRTSDLFELELDHTIGTFDCVVANIQADILQSCASRILKHTHAGSSIILSGILSIEIAQVISAFLETEVDSSMDYRIKKAGEWSSVQFCRKF